MKHTLEIITVTDFLSPIKEFCQINLLAKFRSKLLRPDYTLWKNEKFTLTETTIHQINYLVTLLVIPLLSRTFCQKTVRVNLRNFHSTVWIMKVTQFYCHHFGAKNPWNQHLHYENCFDEIWYTFPIQDLRGSKKLVSWKQFSTKPVDLTNFFFL